MNNNIACIDSLDFAHVSLKLCMYQLKSFGFCWFLSIKKNQATVVLSSFSKLDVRL